MFVIDDSEKWAVQIVVPSPKSAWLHCATRAAMTGHICFVRGRVICDGKRGCVYIKWPGSLYSIVADVGATA